MTHVELIIHSSWIIPVEPASTVLLDHAIAVADGKIVDILPSAEMTNHYQSELVIDKKGHALIPGLINCHGHAAMSLMRGLADDLPLMKWLNEHIWPAEAEFVSPEFVRDGTDLAIAEMLRGGVTCFNDMYFYPAETARRAKLAGMRAVVGLIVLDFPTMWAKDAAEYIHKGLEIHDKFRHDGLISTAFAPHSPYTVSDEPLQKVAMYAEELDIPIHIHLHETEDEIRQGLTQHGNRPIERLLEIGLLSERTIAVHMANLSDSDIEIYAGSGGSVVHCPESNMKLASGFCPVAKMSQAGINIALGTDGAASNNDLDMLGEMRSAALLAKAVAADARAIDASSALEMATINGARALGIADTCGSLLKGKAADIVAINLDTLESQPLYNPISQIVYATGRHQVSDVWVAGEHLLKERVLTRMDDAQILSSAKSWQQKLQQRS
jgi:5-methylthioadenosine/S-adenosylhomocysteine deaminase